MTNHFKNHLKTRLENREEWSDYFLFCLKHWEISEKVSNEYYRDKQLLSTILRLYFLPINIIKFFKKINIYHHYLKTQTEIEVLKNEIENDDK